MKYIIEYNRNDGKTEYIILKGHRFHLETAKKGDAYRFTQRDAALTYFNCMCVGMDPEAYEVLYKDKLKLVALDEE